MRAVDAVIALSLRWAARQWPDGEREEQLREWRAELSALRAEAGGTALARLHFALSLAVSRRDRVDIGGWRESAVRRCGRLVPVLGIGLAALLMSSLSANLAVLVGTMAGHPLAAVGTVGALVVAAFVAPVAWWLGRRVPVVTGHPLAIATTVAAAGAVTFALSRAARLEAFAPGEQTSAAWSVLAGSLGWGVSTAAGLFVVIGLVGRRRFWLAGAAVLVGVPVAVELATAAAGAVAILHNGGTLGGGNLPSGGLAGVWNLAPSLLGSPFPDAALSSPNGYLVLNSVSGYPQELVALTLLMVGYGVGCAGSPRAVAEPAVPVEPVPGSLSTWDYAVGLGALAVTVIAWGYALAILTPAMVGLSQRAATPGGAEELYLWVAELRWTSILLAGLSLLFVTAGRRGAPLSALALVVSLIGVDAGLARAGVVGASGLRIALLAAVAALVVAWWLAGAPRPGPAGPAAARVYLVVVGLCAASCGPLLFLQNTTTAIHPFLPWSLAVAMAVVPATSVLLAVRAVDRARDRPHATVGSVLFAVVPAMGLALLGVGAVRGVAAAVTVPAGVLTGGVLTALLLVRLRRRPANVWWWTLAPAAGALATVPVGYLGVLASIFVSSGLFALTGTYYPTDGLSAVPGLALMVLPVSAVIAWRRGNPPPVPAARRTVGSTPAGPAAFSQPV